jgi:hypothetical protein
MAANRQESKLVPIKFNAQELAAAEWLKTKTRRTRAGAVKWAVAEKAEELGYIAQKTAEPKPSRKGKR